jgi:hypothetical protein
VFERGSWQPLACAVGLTEFFAVICLKRCQILAHNLINLIAWAQSEPSCGADGFDLLFPLVCDAPDQCWCSSGSCCSQRQLKKQALQHAVFLRENCGADCCTQQQGLGFTATLFIGNL